MAEAGKPVIVQAQVVQQGGVMMGGAPEPLSMGFYSKLPRRGICQFCGADVMTQVSYSTGLGTHLMCLGISIVGCVCGCCLIPYSSDSFKDVTHTCPNCHQRVGFKAVL